MTTPQLHHHPGHDLIALADAMCLHGIPEHIRCDNGPEMISKALRKWVAKAGSQIRR